MRIVGLAILMLTAMPSVAHIYTCSDRSGGKIYQQTPCSDGEDFVRCIRPNGSSYVKRGTSCPARVEIIEQQPGMVMDVTTGQQTFMIPAGGNGMIDPVTGRRHQLISPQPTRRVQDQAQPVSADQACAEARAERDIALSNRNRTMTTIRRAKEHYDRVGCR